MRMAALIVAAAFYAVPALAQDVGLVKVASGTVQIERAGAKSKAQVGDVVRAGDVLHTGADGSAGITFTDNSLMSLGPNTVLAIEKYSFDSTTHAGEFDGTLRKGRLAAVSGKMVKQAPESMKVRTPSSVMGVRGTEFLVQVDETVASAR
jgi:hypothetical protein